MRDFCWKCHRPATLCFCAISQPFTSEIEFALIVHPYEVKSTVGTAWILRRSIQNLSWIRSNGDDLDRDDKFLELVNRTDVVPMVLFPAKSALNLDLISDQTWSQLLLCTRKPLFLILDGTWTMARAILRKSRLLQALPQISFETTQLSEYGFKMQPHPKCLSTVESVHRLIEVVAQRGWIQAPRLREHDQMIEIFRRMVKTQLGHEREAGIEN